MCIPDRPSRADMVAIVNTHCPSRRPRPGAGIHILGSRASWVSTVSVAINPSLSVTLTVSPSQANTAISLGTPQMRRPPHMDATLSTQM